MGRTLSLGRDLSIMQHMFCISVIMVMDIANCAEGTERRSPILKVVNMLEDLEAKTKVDGEEAQRDYNKYAEWCRTNAKDLKYEIKTATSQIDGLRAEILKATSDISSVAAKIEDLAATLSEDESELNQAESIRAKERTEFLATEKELIDTVDTLERATNVLQRKLRGSALLETTVDRNDIKNLINTLNEVVNAAALSLHDKRTLMSLAQSDASDEDGFGDMAAPAAAAYSSHSTSVLDMLEDLKQKAQKQLGDLRKQEMNSNFNFESMKVSLHDQIAISNKEMAEAKEVKNLASEAKAVAEGDAVITEKDLASDKERLAKLKNDCVTAASEYEAEKSERAKVVEGIQKATNVITDNLQSSGAASLLQLESTDDGYEIVNFLRKLANKQRSAAMAQLAGRVSTALTRAASGRGHGIDPNKKIKQMLEKMIDNLEKQAAEEGVQKQYCDKEMQHTKTKKDDLDYTIEKFTAQIDKAKAKAASLRDETATLQSELAEMAKSTAEATQMRADASANQEHAKKGLENAMVAVRMATKIMKEVYAEPSKAAASFIQKGKRGKIVLRSQRQNAIIVLLAHIEADLSKELAATVEDERLAQSAYENLKRMNAQARQEKEKDVTHKTRELKSLEKSLAEHASDMDGEQSELAAVVEYKKNIEVKCMQGGNDYASRKAKRQEEIDGLREALKILEGTAVLLQRRGSFRLRGGITVLQATSK